MRTVYQLGRARHVGAGYRRWLKRQTHRLRRRLWKHHGEDAPTRVTRWWAD